MHLVFSVAVPLVEGGWHDVMGWDEYIYEYMVSIIMSIWEWDEGNVWKCMRRVNDEWT